MLTSDLENLFSSAHSHDKYLCQISLNVAKISGEEKSHNTE